MTGCNPSATWVAPEGQRLSATLCYEVYAPRGPHAITAAANQSDPAQVRAALYTDGLVETPGVDLDDAMAGLATQLAHTPPQPMDQLATHLIDHARQTAPRTDDIALLLTRLVTARWPQLATEFTVGTAVVVPVAPTRSAARTTPDSAEGV
ncbi:serine/threonine-protein phosphatase [Streptomyces sp. NBC_00208]|uniref:SpoIIE family protein phosphatase n=1 Tax=Streptomyces sp. NBC_00208 TaxID=2975681 RepID=UPI002E27F1AD|nr:SpoIIE family protein phosphatase [Streptomyces sp. NBC_00208]